MNRRNKIRVIYKPCGKPMELRVIPNTLEACQELVGGYIETVEVLQGTLLVCNEEGKLLGLASNPFLGYDFRGDWFICGKKGSEFTDLPYNLIKMLMSGEMSDESEGRHGKAEL